MDDNEKKAVKLSGMMDQAQAGMSDAFDKLGADFKVALVDVGALADALTPSQRAKLFEMIYLGLKPVNPDVGGYLCMAMVGMALDIAGLEEGLRFVRECIDRVKKTETES